MRITNGMMINNSLNNLNGALTRVSRYNNQLASNRKILTLSDSPVGVLNSLGARNQIRRLEQYQRNVDNSRAWIQQAESSVTEMEELTHTIRELLTDAMGTENEDDKKIFATQMRQYTNSLFELCNASNGTQFMFGGYNVTKHPFTAIRDDNGNITEVRYNGLDLSGLHAEPSKKVSQALTDLNSVSNAAGDAIAKDFSWGGKMTMEGSYQMSNVKADGTKLSITFTRVVDNKVDPTTGAPIPTPEAPAITPEVFSETIEVDLKDVYKQYEGQEASAWANKTATIDLEYKDADGNVVGSFGSISFRNTDKLDANSDDDLTKIAEGIANQIKSVQPNEQMVVSTSVVNAAATTGSKAPAGLNWTGSIADTTQKYPMSVSTTDVPGGTEATLVFTNSFGSPYHTVSNQALQIALDGKVAVADPPFVTDGKGNFIDVNGNRINAAGHRVNPDGTEMKDSTGALIPGGAKVPNDRYTLNLEHQGLGIVTITTQDLYDTGTTSFPPNTVDLANGIASAEYVASKVGDEANQHIQFEVGHNIMTDVTFTGIELVGTGKDNLFNMMIDLANLLDEGADNSVLTSYITKIVDKQDQLLTAVVKSGNRSVKMDTMVSRYKIDAINYEAKRSNIEDIDQAEVIMQMKYSEAIYKQALAASAQIIQPTLMDFLR